MKYTYTKLYFLLLVVALGSLPIRLQAQSAIRKAEQYFNSYKYALAIEEYKKAIEKKPPTLAIMQRLADANRLSNHSVAAESWYAEALKFPEVDPINILYYAQMLHTNGKYEEAKVQYLQYGEKQPSEAAYALKLAESCDLATRWLKRSPLFEVKPATELNSLYSDFSPVSYKDGIIFTSDRSVNVSGTKAKEKIFGWTGRPYLKLYSSAKNGSAWSKPTLLTSNVNASYHNGPATLDSSHTTTYFTRTNLVKLKNTKANPDPTSWVENPFASGFINRLEIYTSEKQGDKWSEARPFAYNKIEEYSVGHPVLSPDGNLLYFISDMPGGFGQTDIYYCERMGNDTWSKPVNAGNAVNTNGREMFPAFDQKGTLYFSSDGHAGFGGLDLFSATGERSTWTAVTNLMAPINSSRNDYGMLVESSGQTGLFSSDRFSEEATADIYSFSMIQQPAVLAVTTLERLAGQVGEKSLVSLSDVRLRLTQPNSRDSLIVTSDKNGHYYLKIFKGSNYLLLGSKAKFLTQPASVQIPLNAPDTVNVTLLFDRIQTNTPISLANIYFDLNKWEIRADAALELDKLASTLLANPRVKIEMGSHCDSREGEGYNQLLSELRAEATVNYLVSQGVSRERLTARGYGESQPVNRCVDGVSCSEEEHQQNRRTTFKIQKDLASR
ncbi:OmpA family protein [Adhaeribacter pallidiroseus]|uniref:Peptidoglycan-associated lipoprotein n=1 Tax=Adhaeribacter pallidiroseus TaxID=2072847 RepID=A0A369QN41_9BACT|nr:OmpA family protein [Adhaeribacter pallidiroseus]RDC64677.1 Peptidoglycan-associated lipoprotein [Adhaeribacter pallidiroseus]